MTPLPPSVCRRSAMFEHRLAEELIRALGFERQEAALDRADRCGRDVAVGGGELGRMVADVLQHAAQVLDVEQQQAQRRRPP